jgi:hypothetical protein
MHQLALKPLFVDGLKTSGLHIKYCRLVRNKCVPLTLINQPKERRAEEYKNNLSNVFTGSKQLNKEEKVSLTFSSTENKCGWVG